MTVVSVFHANIMGFPVKYDGVSTLLGYTSLIEIISPKAASLNYDATCRICVGPTTARLKIYQMQP